MAVQVALAGEGCLGLGIKFDILLHTSHPNECGADLFSVFIIIITEKSIIILKLTRFSDHVLGRGA